MTLWKDYKPFWKSKVLWANGVLIVFTLATWLSGHQSELEKFGLTTDRAATLVALANFLLRFKTSSTITAGPD